MRLQLFFTLLVVIIHTTKPFDYNCQIIARIGDSKVVKDAAKFLSDKYAQYENYDCVWNSDKKSFEIDGISKENIDWENTKIQVVAHGFVGSIDKFTAKQMAEEIKKISNGKGAKKISFVSCTIDIKDQKEKEKPPPYLEEFMTEMKQLGTPVTEVSMRSSLVAVSSRGEILIGEVTLDGVDPKTKRVGSIRWRRKGKDVKWVGKYIDTNGNQKVDIKRESVTAGQKIFEAPHVGILHKDTNIYMINPTTQMNYAITNTNAFNLLDETAKAIYKNENSNECAKAREYEVLKYNSDTKTVHPEKVMLKEFSHDLIKEIVYQADKFNHLNDGKEFYRYGNLVLEMKLNTLYVQVVGIIPSKINSNNMLEKMQEKLGNYPVNYDEMKPKTGSNYFDDVKLWIQGRNDEIHITPENFEQGVFNAQTGAAMFLSESIRCFHNHITNMMALDMVDAHLLDKELFFSKNINPMARGGTWKDVTSKDETRNGGTRKDETRNGGTRKDETKNGGTRKDETRNGGTRKDETRNGGTRKDETRNGGTRKDETRKGVKFTGIQLLEKYRGGNKDSRRAGVGIEERLSRITKTWLSHLHISEQATGSLDEPPGTTTDNFQNIEQNLIHCIKSIATSEPGSRSHLFDYEQRFSGKLLSTHLSEPEIGSIDTQMSELLTVEDTSLAIQASVAAAADSVEIYKQLSDSIRNEESKYKKEYKIKLNSIKILDHNNIEFSMIDMENPSTNPLKMTQKIDNSKLSSKNLLHKLREQSEINKKQSTTQKVVSGIGQGLALYSVVQGFEGGLSLLGDGNITRGTIYLAQGFHGLGDFSGMNPKIWCASKVFLKKILRGPIQILSQSTTVRRAAETITNGVFSVLGKVHINFLESMPIIGTAFAVYNIVEDFQRHSTIGYIDAGFDIILAGLSLLGPVNEGLMVVTSIARMEIDTFCNYIRKELQQLPNDATIFHKFVAGLKGSAHAIIHIVDEIIHLSYISHVKDECKKLDEDYEKQKNLLSKLKDYSNYYQSLSNDSLIDFSSSLSGGSIQFTLGESETSELSIEVIDSSDPTKLTLQNHTIKTTGITDITMGIGESYSYKFKTETITFCFITVKSKSMISGVEPDAKSHYGRYIGNSKDNRFYAIQSISSGSNLAYNLSQYHYYLYGRGGDDFFFLGPQATYVEGNEGSDTYYITAHTTSTTIYNYANDTKYDYLIMYLNFTNIEAVRTEDDVIFTSSERIDTHLVKIKNWFQDEAFQHLIFWTHDGIMFSLSVMSSRLELIPYAFDGRNLETNVTFNAEKKNMSQVKIIVGSPHDDKLHGNDLNNRIDGNGGSDTLIGNNGRDFYNIKNNIESRSSVNNYAEDGMVDTLLICAQNETDTELTKHGPDLFIKSHSCQSEVIINKWFSHEKYRHLQLALSDEGNVYNIISSEKKLKLQSIAIDLALHRSDNIKVEMLFASNSSSIQHTYNMTHGIDLSRHPHLTAVVTVKGTNESDLIIGNQQNNYISPGKGHDFLCGKEGNDVYVIRKGDGMNTIFQIDQNDEHIDTIIFEADYEDIQLFRNKGYLGVLAYNGTNQFLAVSLRCLIDDKQKSEHQYSLHHLDSNSCFELNDLYHIRTLDGFLFKLSNNKTLTDIKIPMLLDYSNSAYGLTRELTEKYAQIRKFFGSTHNDSIIGNSLNNYIDPNTGGCYLEGRNGSDTYVIHSNYGKENVISNYAIDYHLDTLLFYVPFSSISSKIINNNLILFSMVDSVAVTLTSYTENDAYQHMVVESGDGITFALPTSKNYTPTPMIINKSRVRNEQYINLTSNSFLEVITVYGPHRFKSHIVGNELNNTIVGGSKADVLEGFMGDDVLKGGAGNDVLHGGSGHDKLLGGPGNDTLFGGDGDDLISPGLGFNTIYGGNGTDTVMYGESGGIWALLPDNKIYHPCDTMVDIVYEIENVFGTNFNDVLQGDNNDNVLMGYNGDDKLYAGGSGSDILNGGNGTDIYSWFDENKMVIGYNGEDKLYAGGSSSDILNGGNGTDIYSWFDENKIIISPINSTMIINNYATDEKVDTIVHDSSISVRSELGFDKINDDLIIRKINQQYLVYYDNGPIIILKNWFHPTHAQLYRHIRLELREESLDSKKMEDIGKEASNRKNRNEKKKNLAN